MNARAIFHNVGFYSVVAVVAMTAAYFVSGPNGLAGMSLGIFATLFNLWALSKIIGLVGNAAPKGQPERLGAIWTVLAFFVKLPLFVALGIVSQRIGGGAPGCFLVGLGLVYSALVGWALTREV